MMLRRPRPDVSVFAGVPLFDGDDRRRLAPLARHVDRVTVTPGTRLARAGTHPREVVVILAGEVAVHRAGAEVGRLGPGAVIGAAEEADHTAHDADFVAVTAVSTLVIAGRAFRWAMRSLPGFTDRLASVGADQVRGAPAGASAGTPSNATGGRPPARLGS